MADTLTRRHLARLSGVVAASGVGLVTAPPVGAQQASAASAANTQDLLEQKKANRIRAAQELAAFELDYADEPLFRLVLK